MVTKTDSPDPVAAGANITYSIGVSNVGSAAATSVVLTDNTPANTTFQSVNAPAGWTCVTPPVGGTGAVTCSKATHAAGASQTLTLVVRVNPGTTGGTVLTNTVSVTEAEPDPTPGNNSASATTTVAGGTTGPDLVVTKTDSPDPVAAGANITYSIGVSNVGSAAATNVVLTDNTPANTTFQSVSAPAGWRCTNPAVGGTGLIRCTLLTLGAGAAAPLTLVVRVNPGTTGGTVISNTASVSANQADPTPSNNSATATTTVAGGTTGPDLVVTKTDSPDPVAAGANITYSIGVSNIGTAAATSVVLTDNTPANTTFQSVSAPAGWTCVTPSVGGTGAVTCSKATHAAGVSETLTLVVRVNPGTTGGTVVSNTASVSANQVDPTPSNNSATATTTVTGGGGGPTVSIADAQLIESRANMIFTLTLSAPSAQTVTVTAATANNTAAAGSDYLAKTGPVTFMPGQTTQTFAVAVISDTLVEGNETFFVNLSNAINATIADGQAVGTIIDND